MRDAGNLNISEALRRAMWFRIRRRLLDNDAGPRFFVFSSTTVACDRLYAALPSKIVLDRTFTALQKGEIDVRELLMLTPESRS